MFRDSAQLHRKQTGRVLTVQQGEGFRDLVKVGKRLNKKYGEMAKYAGVDKTVKKNIKESLPTIEQKLKQVGISDKVIKPISNEVNKKLGGAMNNKYGLPKDAYKSAIDKPFEIYGTGWFDDMISTLAVLPIPGVSCMARTVAIVKTAVDTATSDEPTKAFGGVVSNIADTVNKIAPPGIKEITQPGKMLLESVGFGMMKPSDREQIVKTGVKHLYALLNNVKVENLPREKANQILVARKTVAQALPKLRELKGKGIVKDAAVRLYAYLTGQDPRQLTEKQRREAEEFEKEHFKEARENERDRQRRIREAKERDLEKKRKLYEKLKGGCADCDEIIGEGIFDFLSKKIINPATRKFTKTMIAHKFGDRYAEAIDKAMERQFKENPKLVLQRLTSKDFWEKSFKTTSQFLKNDASLKKFKKPIGDALNFIPVVGSEMKKGWEKLTKDEGKAKETDLAEDLNKSVRKIQAQEKLFKKYGISPPPLVFGFASAEGYKKTLDEYLIKNKTQLMKMKNEN